MRRTEVATVAVFTAMIVGSDLALASVPNVKLLDSLVFVVAFVYGFRTGALVAILSEGVWAVVSPWGFAAVIGPFLIVGELVFAVAGWQASRVWGDPSKLISNSLFIGATILLCAFAWDLETNVATAFIAYGGNLVATLVSGIPFAIVHEVSDFFIGAAVAPAVILLIPRIESRVR